MIIELTSVGTLPKDLKISFAPDEIDLDGEAELGSDAVLNAEAISEDDKVHIRGRLSTGIRLDCTRCLEAVENPLEIDFDAVFVDAANEKLDSEVEIAGEELDESLVIDGQIDLKEVVREQLLLNLPEQVYCSEDCKGLCPKCGVNRNLIDCKCADEEIDPRWAALKNLR